MDLISILIRTYNSETTVIQTLISALQQSYPKKEILIYDDGSTDNTIKVIKEYIKNSKKTKSGIRIISSKENKGCAYAHNTLVKESKGKFFYTLDSDDRFSNSTVLHSLHDAMGNYDFVYGNLLLTKDGYILGSWLYPEYDILKIPKMILERNGSGVIPFNHGLHRKTFWTKHRLKMELEVGEDTLACIKACERGIRMKHIDIYTILYSYNNGISVSYKRGENLLKIVKYLKKRLDNDTLTI